MRAAPSSMVEAKRRMTRGRRDKMFDDYAKLGFMFIERDRGWVAHHKESNRESEPGTLQEVFQWAQGFAEGRGLL